MKYEILQKPDFAMVKIQFENAGEQMLVEASAMVAKDSSIDMKTQIKGGLMSAAKRKFLNSESIFQNTFTAKSANQTLWLAPAPEGDVEVLECNGQDSIFLSSGAFMACVPSVSLETKWGGAKGFFSGTGLFLMRAQGTGPLFFGAYGGLHKLEINAENYPNGYICDTGHIVAFTDGLKYNITRKGGMKGLFLSGEGLISHFRGKGTLWISTRNPNSLAYFVHPFRAVKSRN